MDLNHQGYDRFVADANAGRIPVGIDRAFARAVYLQMPFADLERETGEAPFIEKFFVRAAWCLSWTMMLGSLVLAVLGFGWLAVLVVPCLVLAGGTISALSAGGNSSLFRLTIFLGFVWFVHSRGWIPNEKGSLSVVVLCIGTWFDRLVYASSTFFLRALVLRNRRAFHLFRAGVHTEGRIS